MSDDQAIQIQGLKAMRDFVVESRRSTVATFIANTRGNKDESIKHIIQCQQAIAAINAAVADEEETAAAETRRRSATVIDLDRDGGYAPIK
jgi:hypothetical protein